MCFLCQYLLLAIASFSPISHIGCCIVTTELATLANGSLSPRTLRVILLSADFIRQWRQRRKTEPWQHQVTSERWIGRSDGGVGGRELTGSRKLWMKWTNRGEGICGKRSDSIWFGVFSTVREDCVFFFWTPPYGVQHTVESLCEGQGRTLSLPLSLISYPLAICAPVSLSAFLHWPCKTHSVTKIKKYITSWWCYRSGAGGHSQRGASPCWRTGTDNTRTVFGVAAH